MRSTGEVAFAAGAASCIMICTQESEYGQKVFKSDVALGQYYEVWERSVSASYLRLGNRSEACGNNADTGNRRLLDTFPIWVACQATHNTNVQSRQPREKLNRPAAYINRETRKAGNLMSM